MMTLTLPDWMVERVVQILTDHPYTGSAEILKRIIDEAKSNCESAKQ